eukprot:1574078-Pyramimonas_sp.AAC.1
MSLLCYPSLWATAVSDSPIPQSTMLMAIYNVTLRTALPSWSPGQDASVCTPAHPKKARHRIRMSCYGYGEQ